MPVQYEINIRQKKKKRKRKRKITKIIVCVGNGDGEKLRGKKKKREKKKKANSPKSIHITLYIRCGSRWEGHDAGVAGYLAEFSGCSLTAPVSL